MYGRSIALAVAALLAQSSAFAINAMYAQQLERSGCTQATEAQVCDITKTKEENAKAGFATETSAAKASTKPASPYTGQWVA